MTINNKLKIKKIDIFSIKDINGEHTMGTIIIHIIIYLIRLSAGDIRSLKQGECIEVILLDRNIGCYMHGTKAGTLYKSILLLLEITEHSGELLVLIIMHVITVKIIVIYLMKIVFEMMFRLNGEDQLF